MACWEGSGERLQTQWEEELFGDDIRKPEIKEANEPRIKAGIEEIKQKHKKKYTIQK